MPNRFFAAAAILVAAVVSMPERASADGNLVLYCAGQDAKNL